MQVRPLNPHVIERVRQAWGLTVRDCFGQTETTAQVGNPPGVQILSPDRWGAHCPAIQLNFSRRSGERAR